MKLYLEGQRLYAGGYLFCRVEAGNGRADIPLGVFEVEVQTATEHGGIPMARADGLGWIGGLAGCDVVVGRVVGRHGVVPSLDTAVRLVSLCEQALEHGERVTLEVQR